MMVTERDGRKILLCEECCLSYKDKKIAEKCEPWCKEHASCNLKITCFSLENNGGKNEKGVD